MRKFFKWFFAFLFSVVLFIGLLYGSFHLWEYSSGGKIVKYLSENSVTIPINESFNYQSIEPDIKNTNLILVGEIHGFDEPSKFDVDFFKYLHKNHNVDHYIAEFDFIQADLLNKYLKTGKIDYLEKALNKWVVIQGRNNKDYFNKFVELQSYYNQLPEDDKFEFIGIDALRDGDLLNEFLITLYPTNSIVNNENKKTYLNMVDELIFSYQNNNDTLFILNHLKANLQYIQEKTNREEIMFQNFSNLFKEYQLEERKLYGFFGVTHVFQYRINGKHPLASKIRTSNLGFEDKILSLNFMMNDSYMVMDSKQLPSFMSDGGAYTRIPVSADNMLIMYIVGIKDLKRMTPKHHKSLIKMDHIDSPYSNTIRMSKTIQILPVTSILEMNDKGKPYVQYTIFVRNSDWAEPME